MNAKTPRRQGKKEAQEKKNSAQFFSFPSCLGVLASWRSVHWFIFLTALVGLGATPDYPDHSRLLIYRHDKGGEYSVKTPEDWARRRAHILAGMQEAMGPLPDRKDFPPLDVKVGEQVQGDGFVRQTVSFVAEGNERVPADLYLPASPAKGKRLPA